MWFYGCVLIVFMWFVSCYDCFRVLVGVLECLVFWLGLVVVGFALLLWVICFGCVTRWLCGCFNGYGSVGLLFVGYLVDRVYVGCCGGWFVFEFDLVGWIVYSLLMFLHSCCVLVVCAAGTCVWWFVMVAVFVVFLLLVAVYVVGVNSVVY